VHIARNWRRDAVVAVGSPAVRSGTMRASIVIDPFGMLEATMLWAIAVVLAVFWFLGLGSAYTMGGLIHVLIVAAVVMVLFNLFRRRSAST
jgi:energy-converting hydrogenase Eha subunit B